MKKLNLVLDLDHTLVHSCQFDEDLYSLDSGQQGQGNMMFKFGSFMTKLRPFVHEFLKEANTMFNLYIYTMGNAFYAQTIVEFLDPHHRYFNPYDKRVFSQEDCLGPQKSLNLIMENEATIIILDDTLEVWPDKDRDNLILMPRYFYFGSGSPDETNKTGALSVVLKQLKKIFTMYFYDEPNDEELEPDVRSILKIIRAQVLAGCNVTFSRSGLHESDFYYLWDMAEELGATCLEQIDASITHVVATSPCTQEAHWAKSQENNKFMVTPDWIEASYLLWQKQPEVYYPPLLSM